MSILHGASLRGVARVKRVGEGLVWALVATLLAMRAAGQPLDSVQLCAQRGDWHSVYAVLNAAVSDCDTCYAARGLLAESMVRLRRELDRAEIILSYQPRTPRNLLLLAEAQRQLYRFADAEKSYQEYVSLGDFTLLYRAAAQQMIASCQSGEQLCMSGLNPWCAYRVKVSLAEVASVVDTSGRKYTIVPLPSALRGEYDRRDSALRTRLAYPRAVDAGTRLIFPRRQFADGPRDLYVTTQGANGLWTQPVSLGPIVNTPYDEGFAILAADGKTLYFSSSGHYGLGGQDIFKSVYDAKVGQWSAPENLGFPYNSPADDYLVGLPTELGEVLVASNRDAGGDSVYIYNLEYGLLVPGVALEEASARYARARFTASGAPQRRKGKVSAARAEATLSTVQQTASFRDVERDPEYRAALAEGYAQQRRADSLRSDLEKLRERVWDAKTSRQREALERRIEPIEKGMLQAQKKADEQFVLASKIEQEYILGVRVAPSGPGSGVGGFSGDNPRHLYLAQLAPTVFQRDEIAELEKTAKGYSACTQRVKNLLQQQEEFRRLSADTTLGTTALAMGEEAVERSARAFVEEYGDGITREQQIYQQCLPVALMKSNRHEHARVQSCDAQAREQYRLAGSLENNIDPRAVAQGQFSAMVFRLLGNRYMELGFSYAWGMVKYRARVQREIDTLQYWLAPREERRDESSALQAARGRGDAASIRLAAPRVAGLTIENPSPYSEASPVPRDEALPSGVVYKLQLGAYTNPINPALFRGMYPVSAVSANGGKVTKYYAGLFREKAEADKGKVITAQCGFPEAFVVAWYDGREVPICRAQALEGASIDNDGSEAASAEVGEYRVEVGRFAGALPDYVSESLKLLAPGKEVQKRPGGDGAWIYSVGVYTKRDDAERLCNNLKGSGLTEARVVDAGEEQGEENDD